MKYGAQRMHLQIGLDRCCRGSQGLGDDLATIQTTPGIPRPNSHEGVGTMGLEIEQSAGIHPLERNY